MVEEDHESDDEESESSSDESEDEEQRIKDVLSHLFQVVSENRTSELLHSMAASKDILFWTPRGQLLRNKGIIPFTNISDLADYVLLPENNGLIKNKKLLSDLIEKEKGYRNAENTSDNESNYSNRSDNIEIINYHDR